MHGRFWLFQSVDMSLLQRTRAYRRAHTLRENQVRGGGAERNVENDTYEILISAQLSRAMQSFTAGRLSEAFHTADTCANQIAGFLNDLGSRDIRVLVFYQRLVLERLYEYAWLLGKTAKASTIADTFEQIASSGLDEYSHAWRIHLARTGKLEEALQHLDQEVASDKDAMREYERYGGPVAMQRALLAGEAGNEIELTSHWKTWRDYLKIRGIQYEFSHHEPAATRKCVLIAEIELARRRGNTTHRLFSPYRAYCAALDAFALSVAERDISTIASARLVLAALALERGDLSTASHLVSRVMKYSMRAGHRKLTCEAWWMRANCELAAQDLDAARHALTHAVEFSNSIDGGPAYQHLQVRAYAALLQVEMKRRLRLIGSRPKPATDEPRKETVILIHGTWAQPTPGRTQWYERGSDFIRRLDAALDSSGSQARCWAHLPEDEREFFWSGQNHWVDRREASDALAEYLEALIPQWRCHLVAHSHGGNVVKEAIEKLERRHPEISTFWDGRAVTLGTPFFGYQTPSNQISAWRLQGDAKRLLFSKLPPRMHHWIAMRKLDIYSGLRKARAVASNIWHSVTGKLNLNAKDYPLQMLDKTTIGMASKRLLALNSEQDEAFKIMLFALEDSKAYRELKATRLPRLVVAAWKESGRISSAQGRGCWFRLSACAREIVIELLRPTIMRKAMDYAREQVCGVSGMADGLKRIRVAFYPQISPGVLYGVAVPLPEKVVKEALMERDAEIARAGSTVCAFLALRNWSAADLDKLSRALELETLVHSKYYRSDVCVCMMADWLRVQERLVPWDADEAMFELLSEENTESWGRLHRILRSVIGSDTAADDTTDLDATPRSEKCEGRPNS